jgi:hypothetical protein
MDDNVKMKEKFKCVNVRKNQLSEDHSTVTVCNQWNFCSSFNEVIREPDYAPSNDRMVFNDEVESTGRPFYSVPENSRFIS